MKSIRRIRTVSDLDSFPRATVNSSYLSEHSEGSTDAQLAVLRVIATWEESPRDGVEPRPRKELPALLKAALNRLSAESLGFWGEVREPGVGPIVMNFPQLGTARVSTATLVVIRFSIGKAHTVRSFADLPPRPDSTGFDVYLQATGEIEGVRADALRRCLSVYYGVLVDGTKGDPSNDTEGRFNTLLRTLDEGNSLQKGRYRLEYTDPYVAVRSEGGITYGTLYFFVEEEQK